MFDLIQGTSDPDPIRLFARTAELLTGVLRAHGVDARIGPVPDEYCPGSYSANSRGAVKMIGTSQRAVRRLS